MAVALSFDSDHETNELRDGGRSLARLSRALGDVWFATHADVAAWCRAACL